MSVLSQMESMQKEMSAAEKKIYLFIRENTEKTASMTASEIAEATNTSAPTVVRFSKKMGYNSLTDFKISLSAETIHGRVFENYSDVQSDESFYNLKYKLANNARFTIDKTTELFNEQDFLSACVLLEEKEFCYVVGSGASSLAVLDIVQKWARLGKNISTDSDYNFLLPQLVTHQKSTVLWLVSNSCETPELISLAATAKELNIPIITLTQFGQNSLSKVSEVQLQTSRPKETALRSAATDSIFAQLVTVDLLFYLYISRNPENAKRIYQTRKIIEHYRKNIFNPN